MSLLELRKWQEKESAVHRMPVEAKLALLVAAVVTYFFQLEVRVATIVVCVTFASLGRVLRPFLKLQIQFWLLAIIITLINALLGVNPMSVFAQLVWVSAIVGATYVLVATTRVEQVEAFLKRLRVSQTLISFALVIWNIFPAMYEEALRVKQAQMARGFSPGNPLRRIFNIVPLTVPLLYISLIWSETLEKSLRARGLEV